MRDEILEIITNKVAEMTGSDPASITEETSVRGEVTLKSIELATLCAVLEEEFDAYVRYTALMHATTIGEMCDAALAEIEG